jgi:hypothetical protein
VQAALAAIHSSSSSPAQQHQHLQSAAVATGTAAAGLEAALDWLCFNVPAAHLPRRFTGSSAAQVAAGSAGVKVRGPHLVGGGAHEEPFTTDRLFPHQLTVQLSAAVN